MSLVTYQETRPWAKAIKERVIERQMPPWHIDKTVGIQRFKNDMSLSDEQINTIARWVDTGAPLGDPKDMPPAIHWPENNDWRAAEKLGQPDLIVKSEPYTMAAHHRCRFDTFRHTRARVWATRSSTTKKGLNGALDRLS
jgi:hypothetical protein